MKRKGLTLVEVLLASTLGFLALTVMIQVIIPLFHSLPLFSARSELLQATAVASRYLTSDLQKAPREGIVLPGDALSIHGLSDVTSSGVAAWSRHLILYQWDSARRDLIRLETPPNLAVDRPFRPTPLQIKTFLSDPNRRKLLVGLAKDFQVKAEGQGLVLQLTLETTSAGGTEVYQHRQWIGLRNGDL